MSDNGSFYTGRQAQLKLTIGGFQAALVRNSATSGAQNNNNDVMLPSVEAAYDTAFGITKIGVYGLYQTYSTRVGDDDLDVTSTALGLRFAVEPGAFFVKGGVYVGTNLGDSNYSTAFLPEAASYDTTNEEDASTLGLCLVAGANFSDMLGIEGGLGFVANT